MTDVDRAKRGDATPRVVLLRATLLIVLLVVGGVLITNATGFSNQRCFDTDNKWLPDYKLLLMAAAALGAGRWLAPRVHHGAANRKGVRWSDAAGILATMALFAAAGAALLFEAVGVLASSRTGGALTDNVAQLEPITHYVRCAIYYDKSVGRGLWTLVAIIVIAFLVGHWLWPNHPEAPERKVDTGHRPAPLMHPIVAAVLVLVAVGALGFVATLFLDSAFLAQPAVKQAVQARSVILPQTDPLQSVASDATVAASYVAGMTGVIVFVVLTFGAIATLDLYFAARGWDPLSTRVQGWAHANATYAWLVVVLLGALIAHFTGNPVHYPG